MLSQGKRLIDRVEERTVECDTLTEADMNERHGPVVWKAKNYVGDPHFYPVYRYEDLYSYSLLALILKKRRLLLDESVLKIADEPDFACVMSNQVLDREITRIGRPHGCGFSITDVEVFAQRIVDGLISDTRRVEQKNPGYTNVVLCGGSDSLNLLLLPWQHETIAISAEPNYEFVKKFVRENELKVRVLKLEDEQDRQELDDEILECACRAELSHWRWGASLRRLSHEMDKKLVYWKGQAGDLYMSTTWKIYMHPIDEKQRFVRRVYRKTSDYMPETVSRSIGRLLQPSVIRTSWNRTASLQGSHMGFIREIADCLTLSAYHGPAVMKVWEQADLASVSQRDMRPLVGRILLGREVKYPGKNPGPALSEFRLGLSRSHRFLDLIRKAGIEVRT